MNIFTMFAKVKTTDQFITPQRERVREREDELLLEVLPRHIHLYLVTLQNV